jgi:hypothetical protein
LVAQRRRHAEPTCVPARAMSEDDATRELLLARFPAFAQLPQAQPDALLEFAQQ